MRCPTCGSSSYHSDWPSVRIADPDMAPKVGDPRIVEANCLRCGHSQKYHLGPAWDDPYHQSVRLMLFPKGEKDIYGIGLPVT